MLCDIVKLCSAVYAVVSVCSCIEEMGRRLLSVEASYVNSEMEKTEQVDSPLEITTKYELW